MSNVEALPMEILCGEPADGPARPPVEVLTSRDVPLGGVRAIRVRRTLPQRARSLIGAWCFVDHYGPEDVTTTNGMVIPPHPHTGLQTVSWLFSGQLEHRDSLGTHALVRPGELNIMTSGHGICHSEVSTPATRTLHGVQLWVALPGARRDGPRDFQHYVPPSIDLGGATARVFLGELAGTRSPVATFTPLLGAELTIAPHAILPLDVNRDFEHGVLVDTGSVTLDGTALAQSDLGYLPAGVADMTLVNPGDEPARLILLGGPPFGEQIVMWWNFVARSHEEIVAFREEWENESDQFGRVEGYVGTPGRLPAPELPHARLKPREARVDHRVVENTRARRFEIYLGNELAGFSEYHLYRGEIAFLHTEISDRFQGHALGGKLARGALDEVRRRGLGVLPYCPFIRQWITKNPDYLDLVPAAQRARFDL